jgi:hypothetical protein
MANEIFMVRPFHMEWSLPRNPGRSTALHDVDLDLEVRFIEPG